MNKTIVLPITSDELCIVADGSVSKHGLGATCTMYANREGKLNLAGFFSAKLRKQQVTWLLCEIEMAKIPKSDQCQNTSRKYKSEK
jgi:hypothetical protein